MRARDDGRLLDAGALHAVAGQGVGVLDVFGDVPRRQLAYKLRVGVDHDPPLIDVAYGTAGAVIDVEVALVVATDHPVPDRHCHRPVGDLLAKLTGVATVLSCERVQGAAGFVVAADQHALLYALTPGTGGPLANGLLEHAATVRDDFDASDSCCPLDPSVRVAVVECGEREPLDRIALAHHLCQPDRTDTLGDRAQPAAGLHRRELPRVADRDHLRPHVCGVREQLLAETRRRHPSFIEDQNTVGWKDAAGVDREHATVERPR